MLHELQLPIFDIYMCYSYISPKIMRILRKYRQ